MFEHLRKYKEARSMTMLEYIDPDSPGPCNADGSCPIPAGTFTVTVSYLERIVPLGDFGGSLSGWGGLGRGEGRETR